MKRTLVLFQIFVLLAQASAYAAYEGTVEMSDLKNINLQPFLRSQYLSKNNLYYPAELDNVRELVLRDSENKISDTFQIPPILKNSTEFWLRIYTEFSTRQVVLFDAQHPEMIYEVVDLRPLALIAKNQMVYEIVSKNKIQSRMNAIRSAIRNLAQRSRSKKFLPQTPDEAEVWNQFLKLKHKHPIAALAHNLRAQTGQRDNVIRGLVAAEAFFPKMEEIFVQHGLPKELTRLCLVESSFNMFANSRVGAAGVWQFMPATAKAYMTMDQNFRLDERLSPLKSTVAAARLLKFNYKFVGGSWPYAVTAYNHGFRGLIKHKRISQTPQACALFRPCQPKMGFASRNYYAEFLALLHAETYKNYFYGAPPAPQYKSIKFHKNDNGHSAIQLAKSHDVPLQELRFLNPDVKNIHIKLPKNFWVAVPSHEDDLTGITAPKKRPSKVRPRLQRVAKL
jgi:membrane-bound lytic murein transglycosylase D